MAKLVQSPPKYLPREWHASNHFSYSRAEQERAASERLRAECERLCKETEATTARTQQSNEHKLSQRLRDISFWKEELGNKLNENAQEVKLLLERKEELEKALVSTKFPLEVASGCLNYREKRIGTDMVHDDVEIGIVKEMEVIEGVQALLQQTLAHTTEQIRVLKSCKYKLEKDLTDKLGALEVDTTCATLTGQTPGIGYTKRDAIQIQTNSVTPEQWVSFTNANIIDSEKERDASSSLRGTINGVLEQTQQDILKQRNAVNLAFAKRIHETKEAKQQLEQHLDKVMVEIRAMEENIEKLKEAIQQKIGPMMLAQTRLGMRSQRPNNELVRDPVQYGLVDEVSQIGGSVEGLRTRLAESESALKALNRNELKLKENIDIKTNSLEIDEGQCMTLRSQLDLQENHKTS